MERERHSEGILELARSLKMSRHAVVLTGAGISTESGIPDFRSQEGIWKQVDPMKVATLTALRRRPVEFYRFYQMRLARLDDANPNRAHYSLARLEELGLLKAVITQNVDGLHHKSGSKAVVEVHGNLRQAACIDCGRLYPSEAIRKAVESPTDVPACEACGGNLKPNVILFGEQLPSAAWNRAVEQAGKSDLFLVVGSSLQVGPVNMLPRVAFQAGARLAIINLEPTYCDGEAAIVIRDTAGKALSSLVELVESEH